MGYCLHTYYRNGNLLNNLSDPFNLGVNSSKILYIDNLAMIFKSILDETNIDIESNLLNWLQLQIDYLAEKNLIEGYLLRLLVDDMNEIGQLNLNNIDYEEDEYFLVGDDDLEIDFCKTFFS